KAATPQNTTRLGANVGYVNVEESGSAMSVGLNADHAVADNFLVGATLDYWQDQYNVNENLRANVSDVALGINTKLIFTNVAVPFRPYVSAGFAGHRFQVNTKKRKADSEETPRVDPYED